MEAPIRFEVVDINAILKTLPHRYPMLLIDRVINIRSDYSGIGIKNVTINEPSFPGHFPERPVYPGVMMIEAMAQTAGVIGLLGDAIDDVFVLRMVSRGDEFKCRANPRLERVDAIELFRPGEFAGRLENAQVVVFLTDGQSDAAQADAVKTGNVRLFTLGLGSDVNKPLLSRLAAQRRGRSLFSNVHGHFRIGKPDEVMNTETLSELYGTRVEVLEVGGQIHIAGAQSALCEGEPHHHEADTGS